MTNQLDDKDISIIKLLATGHILKEIPAETGLSYRLVVDRIQEMKKRFAFKTNVQMVYQLVKADPETFADVLTGG